MNSQPQGVNFTAKQLLQEHAALSATVEGVAFTPSLDAPPDRPFPFVYTVTIANRSGGPVTIKARKWVIRNLAADRCHVTEGDGVNGRFPRLEPGHTFRFNSYHVVAADSVAQGSFLACDESGRPHLVRVPPFTMTVPKTA